MVKKYLALMRRAFGSMLEYRASLLIWMVTNVLPLVMLAAWYSVSAGNSVGGFTQSDFVAYYLLIMFLSQNTGVWVIWELDNDIKHGELAIKLLHPLNPVHEYMSYHLADKFTLRLPLMIAFVAVAAWIFGGVHYDFTPVTVPLFVLALAGAWLLRFFAQYNFGLLAFWISEAITVNEIFFGFYMMLGGMIAPLSLFPPQVVAVAQYLPFRFMLSFPAEILMGNLSATDLLVGTLVQWAWVALVLVIYRVLWARGVRVFSAYGA